MKKNISYNKNKIRNNSTKLKLLLNKRKTGKRIKQYKTHKTHPKYKTIEEYKIIQSSKLDIRVSYDFYYWPIT